MSQQIQFSCFFCYNQMICSLREPGHHSSNRLKNNLLACLKQSVNYQSSVEQAPATYSFFQMIQVVYTHNPISERYWPRLLRLDTCLLPGAVTSAQDHGLWWPVVASFLIFTLSLL